MAVKHAGKLMIIQYEPTPGSDNWVNLCGVNDTTFTISNNVTSEQRVACADRSAVVETIKEYGEQNVKFDASGIWDSDAEGQVAADAARNQEKLNLRVFVPGHGYYEYSEWLIANVDWSGGPNGSLKFSASFEASGSLTFTAL